VERSLERTKFLEFRAPGRSVCCSVVVIRKAEIAFDDEDEVALVKIAPALMNLSASLYRPTRRAENITVILSSRRFTDCVLYEPRGERQRR
jgi:hypothetical protein